MNEMQLEISKTAALLHEWFQSVVRLTDQTLLSTVPEGPHREAMTVDILSRTAREIRMASPLDTKGELYKPLLLLLVAASKRTGLALDESHWHAALTNVIVLTENLIEHREETSSFGLDFGTAASTFKDFLDEALGNSGLAGVDSGLDEENREFALGLALHWGMRFLLAHAVECGENLPEQITGRKDLSWIRDVVSSLIRDSDPSL